MMKIKPRISGLFLWNSFYLLYVCEKNKFMKILVKGAPFVVGKDRKLAFFTGVYEDGIPCFSQFEDSLSSDNPINGKPLSQYEPYGGDLLELIQKSLRVTEKLTILKNGLVVTNNDGLVVFNGKDALQLLNHLFTRELLDVKEKDLHLHGINLVK